MSQKVIEMPNDKLMQLRYESDTWKRLLGFMMDENVHLKFRLSDILKNSFNKQLLEQLEIFQSNFVKVDDLISVLRNDLAELDKQLVWKMPEEVKTVRDIEIKMKKIRNNINNAENQFSQLKSEFISFLSENM
jgi:regulator of replication initiation timing